MDPARQCINGVVFGETGEVLFREVFELGAIGMFIAGLDGRVLHANPAIAEMLGREPEELLGLPVTDFSVPDDERLDEALFGQLVEGERRHYRIDKRLIRKDGSIVFAAVTVSVVHDVACDRRLVLSLVDDITEMRQALAALKDRDEAIRRAYVSVIDAVTGGKLIILTPDEIRLELGELVLGPVGIDSMDRVGAARRDVQCVLYDCRGPERCDDMLVAFGEALNNALKHAGPTEYEVRRRLDRWQVVVRDHGPGIDFGRLPKATLQTGFSTTGTLGMGFTLMLALTDRLLLCTGPGGTELVLEEARA